MPSFAGNVLPRILRDFRTAFPNVEITVHDVIYEDAVRMVESGRVELGFGFEPEGTGKLLFEPLFVDRFVAIVPPRSPLANASSVSWAQLLDDDFICLQRPSTVRRWIETSLAAKGMELRVALECHQLVTVGQFVAAGLGVSAVPQLCERQMISLGARSLRLARPTVSRAIGLIRRADEHLSSAAEAICRAVRERQHTVA
jgi:LysR family carnitine catabolism transcriptional activator